MMINSPKIVIDLNLPAHTIERFEAVGWALSTDGEVISGVITPSQLVWMHLDQEPVIPEGYFLGEPDAHACCQVLMAE